ncbi:MAG: CotH kinase family protein [Planctomycetes bacterium]|nr:CotH kinase family protein [Planctomycetota bacterium]
MKRYSMALAAVVLGAAAGLPAQTPDLYQMDVVRELRLTFKQTNWWQLLLNNYSTRTNIEADLTVDGKVYPRIGARFRGNTSYTWLPAGCEKKGFNIEMDAYVTGQELYGYDSLNLNNGFHDPTFTREVVIYEIARRYGMAPKANYVKLYLNDQYWGIYINVQQPDGKMMDEWFRDGSGNRYRGFPSQMSGGFDNTALNWLGSLVDPYRRAYDFKQGDGTDLVAMIGVLNQTAIANLPAELPKALSVDQAFWYCIAMNAVVQTDSYIGTGKDHFHYHDPYHDIFHIFPFDVNEGLGGEGGSATTSPYYGSTNSKRPLLYRTFQVPKWKARYIAHYRTLIEESFSWAEIGGLVAKYQALIAADVAADTKKIYTTAQFTENVTQNVIFNRQTIRGIKPLVDGRVSFFSTFADFQTPRPTLSDLKHTPAKPKTTDTVYVTVQASGAATVTLHHRIQGPFLESPMYDDGQHGDGAASDGVWGAAIPPAPPAAVVEYHVSAATAAGVMRFLPAHAEFQAPSYRVAWPVGSSPVELGEFLAQNTAGIRDEMGQYEDWIELVNTGSTAVDISGCYLSDRADNPTKWALPAGTVLQPGATLLVWADDDPEDGPYHATFKLAAEGEAIVFFDKDGQTQLDAIAFGPQQADVSTGRLAGYKGVWATFPVPTPRAMNAPEPYGHLEYGPLAPAAAALVLKASGAPVLGGTVTYEVTKAPASTPGHLGIAIAPLQLEIGGIGALLLNPTGLALLPIATGASGTATQRIPIPNVPMLGGQSFYLQAFVRSGATGGLSTAVVTRIRP